MNTVTGVIYQMTVGPAGHAISSHCLISSWLQPHTDHHPHPTNEDTEKIWTTPLRLDGAAEMRPTLPEHPVGQMLRVTTVPTTRQGRYARLMIQIRNSRQCPRVTGQPAAQFACLPQVWLQPLLYHRNTFHAHALPINVLTYTGRS